MEKRRCAACGKRSGRDRKFPNKNAEAFRRARHKAIVSGWGRLQREDSIGSEWQRC
jgi:hypothetical protein